MGIVADRMPTELDESGRPVVSEFGTIASKHLMKILALLFYFYPLGLGSIFYKVFRESPLVLVAGSVAGFLVSFIAWIPAFLIGGIVFGQFKFASKVFFLHKSVQYRMGIGLVFLLFPVGVFLARTINRTASNKSKNIIFFISSLFVGAWLTFFFNALSYNSMSFKNIFSTFAIAIFYFVMFMKTVQDPEPKRRPRQKPRVVNVEPTFMNSGHGTRNEFNNNQRGFPFS